MLQDIKIITEKLIVNIQMEFFSVLGVWCIKLLEDSADL